MTEWEQIKKEYREISIPVDGPHQVLTAMADAKKKRNRYRHLAQYGTVAAALLVILLLPGMLWFSGGKGAANESAAMKSDNVLQFAEDGIILESVCDTMAPTTAPTTSGTADADQNCESEEYKATQKYFTPEEQSAISREIRKQMEERMTETGETYYSKREAYPEGFEQIEENQEYYINTDGLFVIVFRAGVIAPEEQGTVEFVIPAEVALP